jgi:hypothetical protein
MIKDAHHHHHHYRKTRERNADQVDEESCNNVIHYPIEPAERKKPSQA